MLSSKDDRTVVGIIGLGVVGDALRHYFERLGRQVRVYDPQRGLGSERDINAAGLIFVCVPTAYQPPRGFDAGALEHAASILDGSKVIVIESPVPPGTTEAFQCRYQQHCFLTNPELAGQTPARNEFLQPERQIVGYTAQSRHLAESVLALLPRAPYSRVMPAREAELARYVTNAFLALKAAFASEAYDLCTALDADYAAVRDAVGADPRIGPSHLDVFQDGLRGDARPALPDDTNALLDLAHNLGVSLRLLRTAAEISADLEDSSASATQLPLGGGRWLQVLAPDPETDQHAA